MTRRILIVGAGIVGAASLAEVDDVTVTVLEAGSGERLLGSTGHAPGFVGLLNEVGAATEFPIASAGIYEQCSGRDVAGLDRVGGLEVALTEATLDELRRRAERIASGRCVRRRALPRGRNRPRRRGHRGVQGPRRQGGARFAYEDAVAGMDASCAGSAGPAPERRPSPRTASLMACGIRGLAVAALVGVDLPMVAVEYANMYGAARATPCPAPFVRRPQRHPYALPHTDRIGNGSYDHTPLPVESRALGPEAHRPWRSDGFDPVISAALSLLPAGSRVAPKRLNEVFAMTPDKLPLLGPIEHVAGLGQPRDELPARAWRPYRDTCATA